MKITENVKLTKSRKKRYLDLFISYFMFLFFLTWLFRTTSFHKANFTIKSYRSLVPTFTSTSGRLE